MVAAPSRSFDPSLVTNIVFLYGITMIGSPMPAQRTLNISRCCGPIPLDLKPHLSRRMMPMTFVILCVKLAYIPKPTLWQETYVTLLSSFSRPKVLTTPVRLGPWTYRLPGSTSASKRCLI